MLWLMLPGRPSLLGAIATRVNYRNSIHRLLPQQKKDKFKASGVTKDVPKMDMVHPEDVTVELSTRLLAAQ
jgi:hypothetical protein